MSRALVRISTVTLDTGDALELSELLDYLAEWLHHAPEQVRADLTRFALDQRALTLRPSELTRFSRLLIFGDDGTDDDQEQQW